MKHRHTTFGENMALWDRENDEKDWRVAFRYALNSKNYDRIVELAVEGHSEGYDFPDSDTISDSKALEIINRICEVKH